MRRPRGAELVALAIGGAVSAYLGWDSALWDPRFQLALHLAAVAALGWLAVYVARGGRLPRTPLDLPILLLLLAFGVATLTAWNGGLSARALAGVVATAAMLPLAILALRHRPGWTAVVVGLPIVALAAGALAVLAWRRVEWVAAGGPGLPLRLAHEGTPFGSVAVPPFVILAALPLALLVPSPRGRRWLVGGLLTVGLPLTLLSGSRSAWIAIAVAAVVLIGPRAGHAIARLREGFGWTPRAGAAALAAVAMTVVAIALLAPRLLQAESLVYRGYLWRDTLAAWSADPLTGVGPGAMPYARQAAAPALSFPVAQPHSHDIPIGILGEAGILGLVAAALLVVVFVRVGGPWRTRTLGGRAAFAVLAGFGAGMLFEDLTFLPNFNLLVIGLVALVLTDADAVAWRPVALRTPAWAVAGAGGLALLAVMLLGDASAIAYRAGTDAAAAGDWPAARAWLSRAAALDPTHPTGPKALAVAAERNGESALARRAAERAVALNPGDGASWVNLAILCADDGDEPCARRAVEAAVAHAAPGAVLANAALVLERLGDPEAADAAYRRSLLTNLFTSLALDWPRSVDLRGATVAELGVESVELNLVIARRARGEEIDPAAYGSPLVEAVAHAMLGERAAAREALDRAIEAAPASPTTWDIAALLLDHWGEDATFALRMSEVARGAQLGSAQLGSAPPQRPTLVNDIASFRSYPGDGLVSGADPLLPDEAWPWALERLLE